MYLILSQVLGGVAFVLTVWSFYLKNNQKFLIVQTVSNLFLAGSYFAVDAVVGGAISLISLARCIYLIFYCKYNLKSKNIILSLFIIGYIVSAILCWQTIWDIIPLLTSIVFTIAFSIRNMQTVRLLSMPCCILLTIYSVLVAAYTSALLDITTFVSMLVAYIVNLRDNKLYGENPEVNWKKSSKRAIVKKPKLIDISDKMPNRPEQIEKAVVEFKQSKRKSTLTKKPESKKPSSVLIENKNKIKNNNAKKSVKKVQKTTKTNKKTIKK